MRPVTHARGSVAHVWWLKPHTLVAFLVLPLFALLPFLPEPENVRTYFDGRYYALGYVLLCLLCVSSWLGVRMVRVQGTTRPIALRPIVLDALFVLTLCAYIIWFFEILANPALLLQAVEIGAFEIQGQLSNIPGIT